MVAATARAAAVSPGRARRRQGDRKGGGQPPTPRPSSPAAWTTTFRSDPVRYVETRAGGPRAARFRVASIWSNYQHGPATVPGHALFRERHRGPQAIAAL